MARKGAELCNKIEVKKFSQLKTFVQETINHYKHFPKIWIQCYCSSTVACRIYYTFVLVESGKNLGPRIH